MGPASDVPFTLPIRVEQIECRLERELELENRPGTSLATTLRGAFEESLVREGCLRGACWKTQPGRPRAVTCESPSICPVPRLYKPRSEAQGRDHPPPVHHWIEIVDGDRIELQRVLWGRRAIGLGGLVEAAFTRTGAQGLFDRRGAARFTAARLSRFEGTLGEWASTLGRPARLLLELATPCAAPRFDLAVLAGDAAHDLVQWELEDAGLTEQLGKPGCDERAEAARAVAARSFSAVQVEALIGWENAGERASASSGGPIDLSGHRGHLLLTGELGPALPWLAALALRGAGQRRAFGLGRVRLWSQPSFPLRPAARVFLNLSNHDLSRWSPEQRESARALGLGEPADLPGGMPAVPAEADGPAVAVLARALAERAAQLGAGGAFVASDFTLTTCLVRELQLHGVRCFNATTHREAVEKFHPDGAVEKRSVFRFVRWREYPPLG
ncbi:MAG: hypothetical protein NDI82_00010 [Anaeromyxobacteraceae bacterium]|nr:hypothetical protein [Anaeromyxobacteraceae bacterium]